MENRVIWSLFDSETATVATVAEPIGYDVYSFGIGTGTGHINLDLSDFVTAKKELNKYPKPDYIFASPPCESWVSVSVGNLPYFTKDKGLNLHWKSKWVPFDFTEKLKKTRINGCKTALCSAQIINHYKPKAWAIENGNSSLIFDYIKEYLKGYKNKCNYFSYGFDVLKPTIIYSNLKLLLKNYKANKILSTIEAGQKRKYTKLRTKTKSYATKSKVPPELYKNIIRDFEYGGQKTLFTLEDL